MHIFAQLCAQIEGGSLWRHFGPPALICRVLSGRSARERRRRIAQIRRQESSDGAQHTMRSFAAYLLACLSIAYQIVGAFTQLLEHDGFAHGNGNLLL